MDLKLSCMLIVALFSTGCMGVDDKTLVENVTFESFQSECSNVEPSTPEVIINNKKVSISGTILVSDGGKKASLNDIGIRNNTLLVTITSRQINDTAFSVQCISKSEYSLTISLSKSIDSVRVSHQGVKQRTMHFSK